MTSNNCAVFKVFLKYNGNTEVRKFIVDDASVITSFLFMKEKLQTLYPKLRESYFKITWRDCDGDDIIIDNDEDLILAYTEMDDQVKTLYVTVLSGRQPQEFNSAPNFTNASPHIVCDVCNKEITTYRYKCLQCFDYDLCGTCEQGGHHSHHMMLRTATPELPFYRCGRRIFDHVNKAVKKANHMAYREYKKKTRWDNKKGKHDDDNTASGEGTSRQESSSCPFQEYVAPQFYPLIDVISNVANNAANMAANAAGTAASSATAAPPGAAAPAAASSAFGASAPQPSHSTQDPTFKQTTGLEDNATSQFIELVRNALSSVFVQPPQSGTAAQQENNGQTQSANGQQNSGEQQNQAQAPTTPSAPVACEIDLTSTPVEPMETNSSHREPGWTILNDEPVPQPQYPVLQPTMTGPPEPQDPVIAVALQQLIDMGFSDREALVVLLRRYNGSVTEVVKHIFESK